MQSPGPLGTSGADSLQPCQQGASKRNRKSRRVQKPRKAYPPAAVLATEAGLIAGHHLRSRGGSLVSARMCEDTSFGEDFKLHLGCPVCSASLPITAGHERLT